MTITRLLRFIGLGLVTALPLEDVRAETINCTAITSLPVTITVQGIYCLTADLGTSISSGNAITIATNNVTIDMNGHKLGGLAAGSGTTAIGIYALNRTNISLKNGTVRGFSAGVSLDASVGNVSGGGGHLLENLRADFNFRTGLSVAGVGNIIRNNQVISTGGSTVTSGSFGIQVYGLGARVLNNDVIGTTSQTGSASGLWVYGAPGIVIENNRIAETTSSSGEGFAVIVGYSDAAAISANRIGNSTKSSNTYGFDVYESDHVTLRDNSISNMAWGIDLPSGTGVYMNNVVVDAASGQAYVGGTPAGTNYP